MECAKMPSPQRDLRKNYIGLVNDKTVEQLSDKTAEQRAVKSQAKSDHRMKDYFRTLMAAVRNRAIVHVDQLAALNSGT
jgi:hypothetical protein